MYWNFFFFLSRKHLPRRYVIRYFPDSQILCRKVKMQPLKHFLTLNIVGKWRYVLFLQFSFNQGCCTKGLIYAVVQQGHQLKDRHPNNEKWSRLWALHIDQCTQWVLSSSFIKYTLDFSLPIYWTYMQRQGLYI